jgi:hypothetical protein
MKRSKLQKKADEEQRYERKAMKRKFKNVQEEWEELLEEQEKEELGEEKPE